MTITAAQVTQLVEQMQRVANQLERDSRARGPEGGDSPSFGGASVADLETDNDLRRQRLELDSQIATTQEERHRAESRIMDDRIRNLQSELRNASLTAEAYATITQEIKGLQKEQEKLNKINKQFKQGAAAAEQLQDRVLGIGSNMKRLGEYIPTSLRGMKSFGKEMGKAAVSGELLTNVFLKIVSNSIDFALSLDKSTAGFKRATGAGNEYNRVIESAGMKYLAYGVNAENAAKATTDLFMGFRDFTTLSKTEQEGIIATTALMEKFAVSGQTSSQILNQATKSLGMNVGEAEQMLLNIVPLAASVGKPVTEIASDLASAAPKLAFYGANMISVFKELEMQSKATGLSVDELLGLVGEKFDTFEGAGMAVGKLNALLGGPYLNSIDMLNASEADRLEMIQQSMDASGVVFDDLNKFEQKAFASAIGTDVDTLRKSLNDLDPAQQLQNMRQEELAKKAGDARDIMTKLKESINALVVSLGPAIEKISGWINSISTWLAENQGMAKWIGGIALTAGLVMKVVFGVIAQRAAKAQAKAIAQLAASYTALAAAQTASAAAGKASGGVGTHPGIMRQGTGAGGPNIGRINMGGIPSPAAATGSAFGRGAGGSARAMKLGGGAAIGGAVLGAGFNYGAQKAQESGKTGLATGLGVAGGAASGAGTGAMIGSIIPGVGTAVGAGVGALIGGGMAYMNRPVEDGLVTRNASGDVTVSPIDSKDDAIVGKKGGLLAKMGLMGGMGMMGPMGMLAGGAGAMLIKAIVKPIVEAITQSGNTNVVVKIGEKELNKQIIAALNSHQGKQAVSPFYQG